jgi:DNA-binding NarL/FixJ family response regulator
VTFRVLVADDHTLVRQSVVKALAGERSIVVVAETADGPTTLVEAARLQPDLVVLDIAMPGRDGLAVAERLRNDLPAVRILFLSMHDDDVSLRRALELGAEGFVSKSASIEELLSAIRTIRDDGSYLSTDLVGRVMERAGGRMTAGVPELTDREREVLELLADGRRPGEIASGLHLSVKTVKNHLTSVYQKLGVSNGTQAVVEAFRRGLVSRR